MWIFHTAKFNSWRISKKKKKKKSSEETRGGAIKTIFKGILKKKKTSGKVSRQILEVFPRESPQKNFQIISLMNSTIRKTLLEKFPNELPKTFPKRTFETLYEFLTEILKKRSPENLNILPDKLPKKLLGYLPRYS